MQHTHLNAEMEGSWVIAIADAAIATAYFLIPFQIMYFFYMSKAYKKVDHLTIGLLFFLFIMLCGGTHVFNIFPEAKGWQAAVKVSARDGSQLPCRPNTCPVAPVAALPLQQQVHEVHFTFTRGL